MLSRAFASTPPAEADQPNWPPLVIIATASPGGTYHAHGEGLAKLLSAFSSFQWWSRRPNGRGRTFS